MSAGGRETTSERKRAWPGRARARPSLNTGVRNAELERKSELSEGGRGSRALRTEFRRAMGEFSGLASREFKGRGRRRWSSMGMEGDG